MKAAGSKLLFLLPWLMAVWEEHQYQLTRYSILKSNWSMSSKTQPLLSACVSPGSFSVPGVFIVSQRAQRLYCMCDSRKGFTSSAVFQLKTQIGERNAPSLAKAASFRQTTSRSYIRFSFLKPVQINSPFQKSGIQIKSALSASHRKFDLLVTQRA